MKVGVESGFTETSADELRVFVNGALVPTSEVRISVFNWGLLYGDGVFEGLSVADGRCFKLSEHIDRLFASARYAKIAMPLTHEQWIEAVKSTAQANRLVNGYMRPLLTRGSGLMGLRNISALGDPDAFVLPQREGALTVEAIARMRVSAKVLSVRRTPPQCIESRAKLCNYQNNILARLEQLDLGVDVGILLDTQGFVTEAPAANVFLVQRDVIATPRPHNVLNGITRKAIMEIAEGWGTPVVERDLTVYDLLTADEIFTTSSLHGVEPVTMINGVSVGSGSMGSIAMALAEAYEARVAIEGVDLGVRG